MKIEIDEQEANELKFFIGMLIGKEPRSKDGCCLFYGSDELHSFSYLLENIYDQLEGEKDED